MELEIQQCEKTKAVREEQLERLTQICQEQAVSNPQNVAEVYISSSTRCTQHSAVASTAPWHIQRARLQNKTNLRQLGRTHASCLRTHRKTFILIHLYHLLMCLWKETNCIFDRMVVSSGWNPFFFTSSPTLKVYERSCRSLPPPEEGSSSPQTGPASLHRSS